MINIRCLLAAGLILFSLFTDVWAQPAVPADGLLPKLLQLAEPDQLEAFAKLKLSQDQMDKLAILGRGYVPVVKEAKGEPAKLMRLVPEVWGKVEALLTPEQRPLARKLLPRPQQWAKIRTLYQDL